MEDTYTKELAYHDEDSPNMGAIKRAFDSDSENNTDYYTRTLDARNQRTNKWEGKSSSLRKESPDARPWQGSSDNEAWVIDPIIDGMVSLCKNAWNNGDTIASPVGSEDLERATSMTSFMRFCMKQWVPSPEREFELAANYMFEKTIAATYVGWDRRSTPIKERISLEEMAKEFPDFVEMISDPDRVDEAIETLRNGYEYVNEKRAKKALKQLRETGVAEIPVSIIGINQPIVSTKALDDEVIIPPYTTDPEKVSRVHVIQFMDIQELEAVSIAEEWNKEVAQDIIENHMGGNNLTGSMGRNNENHHTSLGDERLELTPIVRTFIKKVDKEDGALGVYEIIWSPRQEQDEENEMFLSHELMNGFDEIPVVFTTFKNDTKRVFDGRGVCDSLRGIQRNVKFLMDMTIDNGSIAMDPPRYHPLGNPPSRWGAGVTNGRRRGMAGEYGVEEVPNMVQAGMDAYEHWERHARQVVGLDFDDPIAVIRQQYFVDRMLLHWSKVAKMVWKVYREYGPEEMTFRITGDSTIAPQTFEKGALGEEMDISISYDVKMNDKDHRKETIQNLISLASADVAGAANQREAMNVAYQLAVPQYAQRILRTAEEAQADIIDKVSKDLTLIASGQSVGAQPNGAQIAMDYINQYVAQPDIQEKIAQDAGWTARLSEYIKQYEFQMQQQQNAQIGRIGAEPGALQGINNAQ